MNHIPGGKDIRYTYESIIRFKPSNNEETTVDSGFMIIEGDDAILGNGPKITGRRYGEKGIVSTIIDVNQCDEHKETNVKYCIDSKSIDDDHYMSESMTKKLLANNTSKIPSIAIRLGSLENTSGIIIDYDDYSFYPDTRRIYKFRSKRRKFEKRMRNRHRLHKKLKKQGRRK